MNMVIVTITLREGASDYREGELVNEKPKIRVEWLNHLRNLELWGIT